MKNKLTSVDFGQFIDFFPELELPVILTDESIHSFSKMNTPLPMAAIVEYLVDTEEELDEFTEFVPCFRFQVSEEILAVVYWQGSLLSYDYYILSIDIKRLRLISKKIIAGTKILNNAFFKSNAVITPEFEIEVLVNSYKTSDQMYPTNSVNYHIEIMTDGSFVSEKETFLKLEDDKK